MQKAKKIKKYLFNKKFINYMEILNNNKDQKHILILKNLKMKMDVY